MTPDPSTANADPRNPQSWNFYAYVNGDPVNANDPYGLCDVIMAGITQNRNNAPDVEGYAAGNGAISVFPYSQHSNTSSLLSSIDSHFAGFAEVAVQSLTAQTSTFAAVTSLLLAAQDGKPINVTTFSGGAAALTAAVNWLNGQGTAGQAVVNMIDTITYVAPGAAQSLYVNLNTTVITGGATNGLVGFATSYPGATVLHDQNNCGHNFGCLLNEFGYVDSRGDPCSKPAIVNQPLNGFEFTGAYNPAANLSGVPYIGDVPYVTSRILGN